MTDAPQRRCHLCHRKLFGCEVTFCNSCKTIDCEDCHYRANANETTCPNCGNSLVDPSAAYPVARFDRLFRVE